MHERLVFFVMMAWVSDFLGQMVFTSYLMDGSGNLASSRKHR